VTCTPGPGKQTVVTDPVVVSQVLGESTSRTDRITKLREYGATPSIQRYVILEQDAIAAIAFVRKGADLVAEALTAADVLHMQEIDIEVPMAEFYEGIEFPEDVATQGG
jgi:Uma2 family endonuclease